MTGQITSSRKALATCSTREGPNDTIVPGGLGHGSVNTQSCLLFLLVWLLLLEIEVLERSAIVLVCKHGHWSPKFGGRRVACVKLLSIHTSNSS